MGVPLVPGEIVKNPRLHGQRKERFCAKRRFMEAVTVSAETGFTEQDHAAALELLEACRAGDISRAQLLIEDGAHAWVQDDQGSTSLHAAVGTLPRFLEQF